MKGLPFTRRFTKEGVDVFSQFDYDYRTSIIRNPSGEVVFEMNNVEVPSQWSQIATDILAQKYFRKAGSDFGGANMGMGAMNFNLRSKSGAAPFARQEIAQSSFAFGNRRKTGSCRVGSKYFNTRRKIGFKNARVCIT